MNVLTRKGILYSEKQKSHLFENSALAKLFAPLAFDDILVEFYL